MRARLLAALAALAAVLVLAACGSSDSSSTPAAGPDPASAVPADSVLYAEAAVRPQGAQSDAVEGVLSKLLGTSDAGGAVSAQVDKLLQSEHTELTYAHDIAPWLGSRAAIFFSKLASGNASDGAIVVATTDPQAASQTAAKAAAEAPHSQPVHDASYHGVSYSTQGSGAFGVVGDFLVAGTEAGFRAVVDTVNGGKQLASSDAYASAVAPAPDDRLATVWVDPRAIVQAVVKDGSLSANGLNFAQLLQKAPLEPVVGWADATPSSIGLELSTPAPRGASTGQSLVSGFPADSWLAFGAHGIGQGLAQGLASLNSLPAEAFGGRSPAAALQRVKRLTGLDLPSFAKWLDDVSGFVAGSSIFTLGGAVVLGSHDQPASTATLAEIERILRRDVDLTVSPLGNGQSGFSVRPQGAPVEIVVQQRDGKVVAGLGPNSVDQALKPDSTLASNSAFKSAESVLGEGLAPSFYLDFAPIASFIQLQGNNPQIEQARPYLDRLDYLIAGSGVDNGRLLSRLVLGVRDGSGSASDVTAAVRVP
jgi:uncharacterized protein DUF3352